jgi:hypothetical protein
MTRSRDTANTQENVGGAVAPFVAGKNAIINGGMDIFQRGTSLTLSAGPAFTADRYSFNCSVLTSITVSQIATADTTNLPTIPNAMRLQRTAANTSTPTVFLNYALESKDSKRFSGQPVVFSFYARVGANYSGGSVTTQVYSGTGTDQTAGSFTGTNNFISTIVNLTTTWQRFTLTGTVPSTSNQIGFLFAYSLTGTAGAADYVDITGIQLETGSVATPFSRNGGTIQGELAACQRYYQRLTGNTSNTVYFATGVAISTTRLFANYQSPVAFRSAPSIAQSSAKVGNGVISNQAITSISNYANAGLTQITVDTSVGSGLSTSGAFMLVCDTNAYIELNSEL